MVMMGMGMVTVMEGKGVEEARVGRRREATPADVVLSAIWMLRWDRWDLGYTIDCRVHCYQVGG